MCFCFADNSLIAILDLRQHFNIAHPLSFENCANLRGNGGDVHDITINCLDNDASNLAQALKRLNAIKKATSFSCLKL
jgi:hypothetical protein